MGSQRHVDLFLSFFKSRRLCSKHGISRNRFGKLIKNQCFDPGEEKPVLWVLMGFRRHVDLSLFLIKSQEAMFQTRSFKESLRKTNKKTSALTLGKKNQYFGFWWAFKGTWISSFSFLKARRLRSKHGISRNRFGKLIKKPVLWPWGRKTSTLGFDGLSKARGSLPFPFWKPGGYVPNTEFQGIALETNKRTNAFTLEKKNQYFGFWWALNGTWISFFSFLKARRLCSNHGISRNLPGKLIKKPVFWPQGKISTLGSDGLSKARGSLPFLF